MAKTERTTAGIREALFEQLDRLRDPESSDFEVARAKAIGQVAKQIIGVAKAELDFHQRMNKDDQLCDDFMTGRLKLGGNANADSPQSDQPAASAPLRVTGR